MADDGEDDIPPERDHRLFSGLTFFLTSFCPTKDYFRTLVESNGGKVCKTDRNADLIISDHLKSQGNVEKAISYKWIVSCVENKELVDAEGFYISALRARNQPVSKKPVKKSAASIKAQVAAVEGGGGYRAAGTRVPFSVQDDNILMWWIEKETKLSGNKAYQELALWCTRHGWQGWRERWVKSLSKDSKYAQGPKPAKDFDITKVPGWKPDIRRPGDGASTSLEQVDDETDSEDERTIDMRPEHVAAVTANLEGLMNAETEDDLDDVFNKIADKFPERSVDEFKEFYFGEFLPRFEKTNGVQSKGELSSQEETATLGEQEEPELDTIKFSIREQRSLFGRFDDIVWADDEEEQLEVCQSVANEFHSHSAEELLKYALTKMKPIIKRLKGKGKVRPQDLEQAVLKSLHDLEESPRKDSGRPPNKRTQSPQKQDTRFEKLGTPIKKGIRNEGGKPSISSTRRAPESTPKRKSSPRKPASRVAQTPPSGQVLVYSPEIPTQLPPQSSPISPSSFHTPGTSRTNRITSGSSVSVRRAPPSIQNSPGTPTPRPRTAVKPKTLLDDDPIPPESSPNLDPLKRFTESIQEHLNSSQKSRKIPPSSPPGIIPNSAFRNLPPQSPPKPLSPVYSSFLSSYEESDQIPYQKPMRAPAASVKKPARTSSSLPSTAKRRKTGSSNHQEMVVESTPERKLFPLPVLDAISSSIGQSSPVDANRQERGYSQTLSPLAYKSARKRKAEERYQEITPPPGSQEIEVERRSDTQDTIEQDQEEEATVVDAPFVMIKEEELEAGYENRVQNGGDETEDEDGNDIQEYGQIYDDDDTQEEEMGDEENFAMQGDETKDEEVEIKQEPIEQDTPEDDMWEEEADPMEMDSLTNRNLGILNDNSPIPAARQSVTPIIPDDSDDISDRSRTQTASESPSPMSQLSVRTANNLVDEITERMRRQYKLDSGAIELVMYATSCNEDVMHVVLEQLSEYQQKNDTLAGFVWPTMRGLWTVEDDKAVNNTAPDDEMARILEKHGDELIMARWDWLTGLEEKTQVSHVRSTPDLEGSVTPGRSSPIFHGLLAPSRENSVAPEESSTPPERNYESEGSPTPRPRRR
ncbi:hypothetical protein TWF281_011094 [Arthrobotrys megalospora]